MRLVSTILLTLILACLLLAQSPIGFGPGSLSPGLVDYFDWYTATASGCTAGSRGMCVGHSPVGDTIYFSGWFADAHLLPITTGLPIVGTLNDFTSKTCGGNLMVIQLAAFDWVARNASRIYEVNCMSGYGNPGATDTPTGWFGHCISGDNPAVVGDCSWKSRSPFVRGGLLYLPVERQIPAGTASIHDATMIVSADGGQTWKNPYTVAHGGAASATGDAPLCGAASRSATPCTDASYPGSIMWPAMPLGLYNWQAVQYGQDGATPPSGINDGCDPATYTCFIGDPTTHIIARVLNTDLPSLDATKYQYYTCPAITDTYICPGSNSSSWTSTFANATTIGPEFSGIPDHLTGNMWHNPVAYIKEFKSYLMVVALVGTGPAFAMAPAIQGPWEVFSASKTATIQWGFMGAALGLPYTVVSSNPPHIQLTTASDTNLYNSQTTPVFAKWDLVLGHSPMLLESENARYRNVGGTVAHAGYVISDSHATGTIPRKDLAWAFDFYDHGGNTSSAMTGFHDIANGSAFLAPCLILSTYCTWLPAYGTSLTSYGGHLVDDGYGSSFVSMMHETPQTIAIGATNTVTAGMTKQNAPVAMQGNGSYTVTGVFRIDATGYNQAPLWVTGDASSTNTKVALSYANSAGGPLVIDWTNNDASPTNRWRYASSFTPTIGNWYFIATTVQANGATPIARMWVGVGGALVDEIAGVSRVQGGTATQTPNVAAAPLSLGMDASGTHGTNASYASLFIHGRALGQAEVGLMYNTVKAKMAARGVTLQ